MHRPEATIRQLNAGATGGLSARAALAASCQWHPASCQWHLTNQPEPLRTVRPFALAIVAALALALAPATAQTSQPASAPAGTVPYADYGFGFELRLPAGWDYDRTRFPAPDGGIGLLRGRDPSGTRTLKLLIFRTDADVALADWLAGFERQLTDLPGTLQVTRRDWADPQRPRAVIEIDTRVASNTTRSGYLCVRFDAQTVWVFVFGVVMRSDYDTPAYLEEADGLRAAFDELGATLEVLYHPQEVERIAAAAERGRQLIEQLRPVASNVQIDPSLRFYEMSIDGQGVGYLTRQLEREARTLSEARFAGRGETLGLRVRERSWRFFEDGTAGRSVVDLFVSFDLASELIEQRKTHIPPPTSPGGHLFTLDQCVRERDVLFSSFSTNRDLRLPDPRAAIRLGPNYLGLAWVRLLPALLGREAGELHAFSIYDPPTRALITHKIRPLGPRELPGSAGEKAYAFEVQEGFSPQRTIVYTDDTGNMLRAETGNLVVSLADEAEIERKYAARREEAERRLKN